MSIALIINGITFNYPQDGDENWGNDATDWAAAVTAGMFQKAGGLFTLTADADFGASFGLKALYYKSRTSNSATTGILRLSTSDTISWRNNANSADLPLGINGSDQLTFNGTAIQPTGSYLTGLTGDVSATGPGSVVATVNSVGGSSAASIHTSQLLTAASTSANTPSTLILRDGSGNFAAGNITASLTGIASGNTTYTANQYGVVLSGSGNAMSVLAPDASTSKVLRSGGSSANPNWFAYDNANTISTLVARDSSGNFSANVITASLTGTATNSTGWNGITLSGTPSSGQIPIANSSSTAVWGNPSAGGYTTTAQAGGTTTLTSSSTYTQYFTGSGGQTVVLPVPSTLPLGPVFRIRNSGTSDLTIVTSTLAGFHTVCVIPTNGQALFTNLSTSSATPPLITSWDYTNIPSGPTNGNVADGNLTAWQGTSGLYIKDTGNFVSGIPANNGVPSYLHNGNAIYTNGQGFGWTSTVTAAGTTVLSNQSTLFQRFTGSTTQIVTLPVVSTFAQNGFTFRFINSSTGAVTVNSSGVNLVATVSAGTVQEIICIDKTAGTGASAWFAYVV